jgi:hypothetical protein
MRRHTDDLDGNLHVFGRISHKLQIGPDIVCREAPAEVRIGEGTAHFRKDVIGDYDQEQAVTPRCQDRGERPANWRRRHRRQCR